MGIKALRFTVGGGILGRIGFYRWFATRFLNKVGMNGAGMSRSFRGKRGVVVVSRTPVPVGNLLVRFVGGGTEPFVGVFL